MKNTRSVVAVERNPSSGKNFVSAAALFLKIMKIFFKPEIKVLQYVAIPKGFENFHRMSMFDGFVKSRFCLFIKI